MGKYLFSLLTLVVFVYPLQMVAGNCACQNRLYKMISNGHQGKTNETYTIKKTLNLKGKSLQIPHKCVLRFQGGKIKNGTVVFNETIVEGERPVFENVTIQGTLSNDTVNIGWFNVKDDIANVLNVVIGSNDVKVVNIPDGTFLWKVPVRLRSKLTIIGAGEKTRLKADRGYLKKYPNTFVMLTTVNQRYPLQSRAYQYHDPTEYKGRFESIEIRNLTFDLNYYGGDNVGGQMAAIKIEDASNVVIDNCHFVDGTTVVKNHTYHAVYFVKSRDCEVRNCHTENISFVHIIGCEGIICRNNYGKNSIRTWLESNDGREITYSDNILEGNTSMTSAISFNSRASVAVGNVIRTNTPIICGMVLGHQDENGLCNVADSCVVRDNSFEIVGNGEHDYGILVQNGKGVVIDNNNVTSSGNTVRINKISQAIVKNNTLLHTNVSSSNVCVNSHEDNILLSNVIMDTGLGNPSDYNLVIYIAGGKTQIKNNKISTNAQGSLYNLVWAVPGGDVNSLEIEGNEFKSVSLMGHVENLKVVNNIFSDITTHLFTNSVNKEGKTNKVLIKGNNVTWKEPNKSYLLYLTGKTVTKFRADAVIKVENNIVNTARTDMVRYHLNGGKITGINNQIIRDKE